MLKATIHIGEEKRVIELPQDWVELRFDKFIQIQKEGVIKAITGIEESELDEYSNYGLVNALEWLNDIEGLNTIAFVPDYIKKVDISRSSWGKLEKAKQLIGVSKVEDEAIIEICKTYTGVDLSDKPTTEGYGVKMYLVKQFNGFFEQFKELSEHQPDQDEIAAGIDDLDRFGFFNTVDSLAGGDLLKHDELLKLPAVMVYTKLLKNMYESRFQKRLYEIKSRKA